MTPTDALTKIEAELAAATPDDLLRRVITAWDHKFTHPANSAVEIVQPRIAVHVLRPTYLAALLEVARAAEFVRHESQCAQVSWAHLVLERASWRRAGQRATVGGTT